MPRRLWTAAARDNRQALKNRRARDDRKACKNRQAFAFSRRDICPSFANSSRPLHERARGMPGAQCTRSLVCAYIGSKYAHQYSQRRHRKHPAFPTQWFYSFLRALPGDHRFVDPVIRATRWHLANLTPASGRQNHTASPSAPDALVSRAVAATASHLTFVTIAKRPSCRGGTREVKHRFLKNGRVIFRQGRRQATSD